MNIPTVSLIATSVIGFGTVVNGVIAVYIAHQQSLTNRNQLRFHLFDKRFAVYKAAMTLVTVVMVKDITGEEVHEFEEAAGSALFLFGDDGKKLQDCCDQMRNKALALLADQITNPESERGELVRWFSKQFEEIPKLFAESLKVTG
jgi:hypothetical protein